VHAIRHLLAQRHLAVLICAAAMMLKLLVPTGYMIAQDHGRIVVTPCSGMATDPAGAGMTAKAMPGMHAAMAGKTMPKDHGKPEMPCAFSGLSAAIAGGTDPIQVAALVAFVMAIGLAGVLLPAPFAATYLRPPLRGPPAVL